MCLRTVEDADRGSAVAMNGFTLGGRRHRARVAARVAKRGSRGALLALAAFGVSLGAGQAASAHHYENRDPRTAVCTNAWDAWGGEERSNSEPDAPTVRLTLSGKGVRTSGPRPQGVDYVGELGPDKITASGTATPAQDDPATVGVNEARAIDKFCRFFDDPYRDGVYDTVGSREHYNDVAGAIG